MKKKVIALILYVALLLTSVFPATALAEGEAQDGTEQEASVCTCESKCAEGAANADCPVCSAEGAALAEVCKGKEPLPQDEQEQPAPAAGPALLSADGEDGVSPQAEGYDVTVTPTTLDFGTVNASDLGEIKEVTVTNTGTETVILRVKADEYRFNYVRYNAGFGDFDTAVDNHMMYYTATLEPGESAGVKINIYSENLIDEDTGDYSETTYIPVYEEDGKTRIEKTIEIKIHWEKQKQAMEVTPTTQIDLGTVGQGYGETVPMEFTIKNSGNLILNSVSCDLLFDNSESVEIQSKIKTSFKLNPNIYISEIAGPDRDFLKLDPDQSQTIKVYVAAGLPQGTYTAKLEVKGYNYTTQEYVIGYIPLTFTVGEPQYGISAAPDLDFGTAGLSNTRVEAKTVTITNTGNTSDTITLPTAENFDIIPGDGFSGNSATIAQGRTASFTVQPKADLAEDNYDTEITLTSTNGAQAKVSLKFRVERKDCDLKADVAQLDFGYEQEDYGRLESKTVTLTNVGKDTLTVSLPTAQNYVIEGGDGFTGDTASIVKDATASFTVRPKEGLGGGSYPETLNITGSTDTENASWTVALSFSVEPKIYEAEVSPAVVSFDNLRVGYEQPAAQTVTVTNTGNQILSLELPELEDYEIQPAEGFGENDVASLSVNGKASFTVRPVAGLAQGDHSATLTLTLTGDDGLETVEKELTLNCDIGETALIIRFNNDGDSDFGTVQGSGYTIRRVPVTVALKEDAYGVYTFKLPANDPVYVFEPYENIELDKDGQFYTGTVERNISGAAYTAGFFVYVRENLPPDNYDRVLDLGNGLMLSLQFTVERAQYEIIMDPRSLNFGTIVEGIDETPAAQTVTVTNTGSNPLTVSLPDDGEYIFTAVRGFEDRQATLDSDATASFTVQPRGDLPAGNYDIIVNVNTDQAEYRGLPLFYEVKAQDYTLTADPSSLEFGTVTVDDPLPQAQTITITNNGNVTNTVRLPESDAYTITGVTGFEEGVAQLLPQETASFTVQPMAGLAVKDYSGGLSLSGSGNSQVTINVTYVLNKGQAVVTEAPQAVNDLKYNGSAQALVTAGAATGGELLYSLDRDGEYSADIPTATDAGSYTVWYKVEGDETHNGTAPAGITVEIAKADASSTVRGNTLTYNGEPQELVTAVSHTDNPVLFSNDKSGQYTETVPTATDAGTYTVWYKMKGDDNHEEIAPTELNVTIGKLPVELEWSEPTEFTYDKQNHSVTAAITNLVPNDDVTLSYSDNTAADAGNYTAAVTLGGADAGNYTLEDVANARLEWSIKRADITYATTTVYSSGLVYDGKQKMPRVEASMGNGTLRQNTDYTVTYKNNINAGVAQAIFTGIGNYSGTVTGFFTIPPCPLTVTGATLDPKTYDGSTAGTVQSVSFVGMPDSQSALVLGQDYSATVEYSDPSVGAGKTATVTVTLLNTNYSLENNTFVLQNQAIDKATYNGVTSADGYIVAGSSLYSLKLPSIPDGASYGTPKYTGGDNAVTNLSIEGVILYYTGGSIVDGNKYEITIPVDGGTNYNDYDIIVTLTGTDKISLSGTPTLSTDTITYGQSLNDISLSGSMYAGATPVSGTFTWARPNDILAAGTYKADWLFTPEEAGLSPVTDSVELTVYKRTVDLYWGTTTFVYDGSSHSVSVTISNVVQGDILTAECGGTLSATEIGEYTATVTGLSGTAANNYTLDGVANVSQKWNIKSPVTLVSSVTMSRSSLRIYEGRGYTLSASVSPQDATDKTLIWSSSDPDIATVDQNGNVTGKAPGVCVIYATAADGGGAAASCTVRVLHWYPGATPITGDSSNLGLWIGILGASLVAVGSTGFVLYKKKK